MDCIIRIFTAFNEGTYSVIIVLPMHSGQFFQVKCIVRCVIRCVKVGCHVILC